MKLRLPRLTLRVLMLVVAALAVASALVLPGLRRPGPPRLRCLEIFYFNRDGSDGGSTIACFNLDVPIVETGPSYHLAPGRDGSFREAVEDAKSAGLEYLITIPRAINDGGQPIY